MEDIKTYRYPLRIRFIMRANLLFGLAMMIGFFAVGGGHDLYDFRFAWNNRDCFMLLGFCNIFLWEKFGGRFSWLS